MDDVVFALNLSTGTVNPLTYEDESQPFHNELWADLQRVLHEFEDNAFHLHLDEQLIYSDLDTPETDTYADVFDFQTVLRIFKECVERVCG